MKTDNYRKFTKVVEILNATTTLIYTVRSEIKMLGSIIGDVVGSCFEFNNYKHKEFKLFNAKSRITDDTILTLATIDVLLNKINYKEAYSGYVHKYSKLGRWGPNFLRWAFSKNMEPYNSYGNGSAMRVSPIGLFHNTEKEVLSIAKKSAEVTHNHPEGIKGAQAIAMSVFLAKKGKSKQQIIHYITDKFKYDLKFKLDDIREKNTYDMTCQVTVPLALIAFAESTDFEDAIRNAISIGGDSDTIAAITGSIAEVFYNTIDKDVVV